MASQKNIFPQVLIVLKFILIKGLKVKNMAFITTADLLNSFKLITLSSSGENTIHKWV